MANTIHYPFGQMDKQTLTINTDPTPNEVVYEVKNNKTFLVVVKTDVNYNLKLTAGERLPLGAELSVFLQADAGETIEVTADGDMLAETINLADGATGYYTYVWTGEYFAPVSDKSGLVTVTTTTAAPTTTTTTGEE